MDTIYLGLFLSAFIAATLLPAFSELSFAAALTQSEASPLGLFLAVSTGNILGAIVNWWLGRYLSHHSGKKWFPFKPASIEKASLQFNKYGHWSLLFAWLPIVGDPLTFVAGILKTPFRTFLLFVSIGKTARYAVIWASVTTFAG